MVVCKVKAIKCASGNHRQSGANRFPWVESALSFPFASTLDGGEADDSESGRDKDLEAAIAASKRSAEEEASRSRGARTGDDELEQALRLSREEEERRRRELAGQSGGSLFDDQFVYVFSIGDDEADFEDVKEPKLRRGKSHRYGNAVPATHADWLAVLELQPVRSATTADARRMDAATADGRIAATGALHISPFFRSKEILTSEKRTEGGRSGLPADDATTSLRPTAATSSRRIHAATTSLPITTAANVPPTASPTPADRVRCQQPLRRLRACPDSAAGSTTPPAVQFFQRVLNAFTCLRTSRFTRSYSHKATTSARRREARRAGEDAGGRKGRWDRYVWQLWQPQGARWSAVCD